MPKETIVQGNLTTMLSYSCATPQHIPQGTFELQASDYISSPEHSCMCNILGDCTVFPTQREKTDVILYVELIRNSSIVHMGRSNY